MSNLGETDFEKKKKEIVLLKMNTLRIRYVPKYT